MLARSQFETTREMMNVSYKHEDVRHHVNELCEFAKRASGFTGTGWQAKGDGGDSGRNLKALHEGP